MTQNYYNQYHRSNYGPIPAVFFSKCTIKWDKMRHFWMLFLDVTSHLVKHLHYAFSTVATAHLLYVFLYYYFEAAQTYLACFVRSSKQNPAIPLISTQLFSFISSLYKYISQVMHRQAKHHRYWWLFACLSPTCGTSCSAQAVQTGSVS